MSTIDPEKQAIVQELMNRRDSLDPDKQAIVDELGKRFGLQAAGQQQPQPTWLQKVEGYLPGWRTALRTGGAAAGGAIGFGGGTILGTPVGGVPGAALGGA